MDLPLHDGDSAPPELLASVLVQHSASLRRCGHLELSLDAARAAVRLQLSTEACQNVM